MSERALFQARFSKGEKHMYSMEIRALAVSTIALTLAASGAVIAAEDNTISDPDAVEWGPGPDSIEEGAEAAVLYGDPGADGVFALRLKLPDGYHIAPHNHPRPEVVTILSGTLRLGHGNEADREATEPVETGGFFAFDPGMTHYVYAEGETVIQLNSVGPWSIEYVDPEDDPRTQ